jgi:hypothetical protein
MVTYDTYGLIAYNSSSVFHEWKCNGCCPVSKGHSRDALENWYSQYLHHCGKIKLARDRRGCGSCSPHRLESPTCHPIISLRFELDQLLYYKYATHATRSLSANSFFILFIFRIHITTTQRTSDSIRLSA